MSAPNSSFNNLLGFVLLTTSAEAFRPYTSAFVPKIAHPKKSNTPTLLRMIYAPPGSGWQTPEDEVSTFPDTYDPMMEYPGTMRPGRTPENMPFQDLPIHDTDPDPVPWPHFQQIEWHHKWDPPHPHPIPMEDYIEMEGRWATAEMEARMRAGVRRDVRERQEQAAKQARGSDMIITDDDEDDINDEPVSLGDGVFGSLGSDADAAITAEAVRPKAEGEDEEEEEEEGGEDDDLDSFLLDLGLDADVDDAFGDDDGDDDDAPEKPKGGGSAPQLELSTDGGDSSATISVDEDEDLDLGLDEDDEMSGDGTESTVPLEDFDNDNDTLASEDIFDDGGFDYDSGDFGGDDVW